MNIPVLCNENKIYRADCIKSIGEKKYNFIIKSYTHKSRHFIFLLLLKIFFYSFLYKKIIIVIDYWAIKPVAIISSIPFIANKLIIDFYDIFTLRPVHPQLIDSKYERVIINNCKFFFARSFELNHYFKSNQISGKKCIFFPDIKPIESKKNSMNVGVFDRIVFLGGIGPEDIRKLDKIDSGVKLDIFLAPDQNEFPTEPNITLFKSVDPEKFNSILGNYHFAICLINEDANVFNISAASKYMAYLESGLIIITDPRHRISKWYKRYYPNSFIFINDNNLAKIDINFLTENYNYLSSSTPRSINNINFFIFNLKEKITNLIYA